MDFKVSLKALTEITVLLENLEFSKVFIQSLTMVVLYLCHTEKPKRKILEIQAKKILTKYFRAKNEIKMFSAHTAFCQ